MLQDLGYAELYSGLAETLTHIDDILYRTRNAHALSMRSAAEEIGICPSSIYRVERGEQCTVGIAVLILRWAADRSA